MTYSTLVWGVGGRGGMGGSVVTLHWTLKTFNMLFVFLSKVSRQCNDVLLLSLSNYRSVAYTDALWCFSFPQWGTVDAEIKVPSLLRTES